MEMHRPVGVDDATNVQWEGIGEIGRSSEQRRPVLVPGCAEIISIPRQVHPDTTRAPAGAEYEPVLAKVRCHPISALSKQVAPTEGFDTTSLQRGLHPRLILKGTLLVLGHPKHVAAGAQGEAQRAHQLAWSVAEKHRGLRHQRDEVTGELTRCVRCILIDVVGIEVDPSARDLLNRYRRRQAGQRQGCRD